MADAFSSAKSKYLLTLDQTAQTRYTEKLMVDGRVLPDPYCDSLQGWSDNVKCWPAVEYGDIYSFLINTPGQYTKEKMRAVKSLDGYNYFVSGHVQTCYFNKLKEADSVCFLKCKVAPSQRANDKPHEPWVCLDKRQGYVVAAHCTCKAGLGEACSHIAAVLFKIEAVSRLGLNEESKTSLACVWNKSYRKKVRSQPISQIDFTKPKHAKQTKRKVNELVKVDELELRGEEIDQALKDLKRVCPNAGCLTKGDSDTDSASDDEDLPTLLGRYHDIDNSQQFSEDELIDKCQMFLRDFSVTQLQSDNLEKMTRAQNNSLLWKKQREGRITATIAHDIKTLKNSTSTANVLGKVMKYTSTDISKIDAVAFGNQHEKTAKAIYQMEMDKKHDHLCVSDCGLVIDTRLPLLAATPDGVRSCKCHGTGLLEIKCSFKHRDNFVHEIPDLDSSFYLEKDSLSLKCSHRYFTQIQFQMYICKKTFCDFVVYTDKGIHMQTIFYDSEFANDLVAKCTSFALDVVVPEIIKQKFNCK